MSWDFSLDELRGSCWNRIPFKINEIARGGADVFRAEIVYMSVVQRRSRNRNSAEQQNTDD